MKNSSIQLGFDVLMETGSVPTPKAVQFWNDPKKFKDYPVTAPLHYMADALVGLSFLKLNGYFKSPLFNPSSNYQFQQEAWLALDPHHELYSRSQTRVQALKKQTQMVDKQVCENFEKNFSEVLENSQKPWGLDLIELQYLIDSINYLESQAKKPLLYSFSFEFSKNFYDKLQSLYSLLFHLRTLVAVDHNAHIVDPTHEGVKVDSISDYLPKPEYVVNDAILYHQFKKLSLPWVSGKNHDARIEKLFVAPFERSFAQYSHNACHLINNLNPKFLASIPQAELEETLYLVQMDWLLGTESGLLFKIREELYGLQEGYAKVFWPEQSGLPPKRAVHLQVCCELKDSDLYVTTDAA